MRRFQFAIDDLVADRRPAHFAPQLHVHAVFGEKAQFVGHDYRSAVGERYEAKPDGAAGCGAFFTH
jgi:hypothetical protein